MNAIDTQSCDLMKLGTDPMTYGDIDKWTPPRKSGGIPLVSTRFSLGVENKEANAGRDGRTSLARPCYQALLRTGTGEYLFSLFG